MQMVSGVLGSLGFRVSGLGFRVSGLGLRVEKSLGYWFKELDGGGASTGLLQRTGRTSASTAKRAGLHDPKGSTRRKQKG